MTNIIAKIRAYIEQYVVFSDKETSLPLALWVVGTYLWPGFDSYPYLVITSETKRAGKTRCAEILSFCCNAPRNIAAMTPAGIFNAIETHSPTLFMDEAETLASESASVMRAVLNVGYRAGQTVERMKGDELRAYRVYCPKVFILIGDVYDTLRDRSIIVKLRRANIDETTGLKRFVQRDASAAGAKLRTELQAMFTKTIEDERTGEETRVLNAAGEALADAYRAHDRITFLSDRDEEIWLALFTIGEHFGVKGLDRIAVDMVTEKTAEKRTVKDLRGVDDSTQADEYAVRLLVDVIGVMRAAKVRQMFTRDILKALYAIDTAPWRKLRGVGINANDIGNALARFTGADSKTIRIGGRDTSGGTTGKGYVLAELLAAQPK